MVVGFGADGRARNVIGIDASCTRPRPGPRSSKSPATAELIGARRVEDEDVVIKEDYAYPVYGVPSKETVEAIRLSARLEGMITDPVTRGSRCRA